MVDIIAAGMPHVSIGGFLISGQTVVIGTLSGLTYAILAAGIVLIYRATKVINFAHGQIGAFGAAVLAKLVLDEGWNYWLTLVVILAAGGLIGAAVELGVVRRLFKAPRLVLLVATIGVSQLMLVLQALLPGVQNSGGGFPTPLPWSNRVDGILFNSRIYMVLLFVPAVIAALAFFLNRTRYGLAIRAAATNPERAELVGISTRRVSTLVWVLAGVLSTLTAVLVNPLQGAAVGLASPALGPSLLLRALAAAMVGGLTSLPLALIGGVGVGLLEAVLLVNTGPGVADAVLFVAVLGLVLFRTSSVGESLGSWRLGASPRPVPASFRGLWWVVHLNRITAGAGILLAFLLPLLFGSAANRFRFSETAIFALAALSVSVLTGWAGQLSLGQFAFVGVGATLTATFVAKGMPFAVAVVYATVGGVLLATLIGFPALRVRGMFLAVITLAFAVASQQWLFNLTLFTGGNNVIYLPRQKLFGWLDLRSELTYYYVCLVVLIGAADGVARLRRSGIGRRIISVRDNELAAASFAISPAQAKLIAFAVAGGLAALAGSLLAGAQVQFQTTTFSASQSLEIVAIAVIGGLGSVAGAILGAIYIIALPALLGGSPTATLLTSGVGLLLLLLYLPGGLLQLVYLGRDAVFRYAERHLRGPVHVTPRLTVDSRELPSRPQPVPDDGSGGPSLLAEAITVQFGGRTALNSVSIAVGATEVVGLIGSNGAGKSTLMNVISGFVTPTSGCLSLFGSDVTALAPHERAGLGMGRVFQDAALFGSLTVRETVKVALECRDRSEFVPSLLGFPPSLRAEKSKQADAEAYVDFLGLGRYIDTLLSELSTGTRRIVEMCCLLAQGSKILLLDEPTAGVAQKETEMFGPLIRRIQAELYASVLIIEHDIPLVMSISDRVYCFSAGLCIAQGEPEDVRRDPSVVAAYLGTDERAINRSSVPHLSVSEPMPELAG